MTEAEARQHVFRIRQRLYAGRVVGHFNVRRCDRCAGWHHRLYHARERNP